MTEWSRWSTKDPFGAWWYATRRGRVLTVRETQAGLVATVEARTAVQLEQRIREQDALDRELQERQP